MQQQQQPEINYTIRQRPIRIACLGNSIQYYNDCPRLLEHLFQEAGFDQVHQDSCLRGGASIITLWKKGNGMQDKFATPNAVVPNNNKNNTTATTTDYDIGAPTVQSLLENDFFDFAIINDHTQSAARLESRTQTLQTLEKNYAPLLFQSKIVPIFLQTAAYRLPNIRGTDDLGDFDHYHNLLQEGYQLYKNQMDEFLSKLYQNDQTKQKMTTQVAPVGVAYAELHTSNHELWKRLYDGDNFHPSPHGTLLQAYVLFMTLVQAFLENNKTSGHDGDESTMMLPPTTYDISWWDRARRMQPPEEVPLPLPTKKEAEILRQVAIQICSSCWKKRG